MPQFTSKNKVLASGSHFLTSPFGMRINPVTRVKAMHNGVDLVAYINGSTATDYIVSFDEGKVIANGYDKTLGNFVEIRNGNFVFRYQHLKDLSPAKVGMKVAKGARIGMMGNTGSSAGAHLHFGIKVDGNWVDPMPYLLGEKDMEREQFNKYMQEYEAEKAKQPASAYAKEALDYGKKNGITDGTRPKSFCTREEVATMIYRGVKK